MSSYQDYANAVSDILEKKGSAQARATEQGGQLWGSTIANLGQVIPQQVQQAIAQNTAKKKQAQITGLLQQAGPDLRSALPQLRALDPKMALDFEKELDAADEVKAKSEELKAKHDKELRDFQLGTLAAAQNPSQWASGLKGLHDAGVDVSGFDPEYSPEAVRRVNLMLAGPDARLKATEPKEPKEPRYEKVETTQNGVAGTQFVDPSQAGFYPSPPQQPKIGVPPNVGSFEDYVTRTYGANPTPEQVIKARRDYGTADDRLAGQQAADITNLTPAGIDMAALNYRKTGQLPPLGMGDRTTRQKILNRAAELTPADVTRIEAGGTDVAGNKAAYRADSGSLVNLQKQRDAIGAFENTAQKNIDNFLAVARKVPDTGIPLLNTPVRWIAGAGGSADMAKYNAARQVAVSEIAKIVQNPNLSGQLSDSARKEIEVFNPSNATLGQTIAVMNLLKQDMNNRKTSLDEQLKATKGRIGGGSPETTTPAPAPAIGGLTYQDYLKAKGK